MQGLLETQIISWTEQASQLLPDILLALSVVIFSLVLAHYIRDIVRQLTRRISHDKSLASLFSAISSVITVAIGIIIALQVLDLGGIVGSLLAGAGILGLTLGFALQDVTANFISGIIIAIQDPFKVGDIVKTNDYFGTVQRINLRMTEIKTPDGQTVVIPNRDVLLNPLVDYTTYPARRVDLNLGVSYGDNLEQAKEVATEAIQALEATDQDKEVEFFYTEFGDSAINFQLRFWVDFQKQPDYLEAQSQAVMAIKEAYDKADIDIPFPIRTLDFGVRGGLRWDEVQSK